MSVAQNYIVTTVGSCGVAASETFVLDIRPEATITVTSDISTINQAICQSGSIEPITFTIGGGATGIEPLSLPDNLVLDFDIIEQSADQGAPKYMEDFGAMALTATLVWLYAEILRLIAKLRSR